RVLSELFANVLELAVRARKLNVGITIDAEEADRLELSLELYEKLMRDPAIAGWGEFGLVIQAYSKRCLPAGPYTHLTLPTNAL
ncbi:proline dehydrogenase family protein, partial [Escherichia coli]|nr:proline dehydrogenase family protein [Escherichia coli]